MKRFVHRSRWILLALTGLLAAPLAAAAPLRVAVASNFVAVLEELGIEFEKTSEHTIAVSGGATGALYTQITNGAPFDVFFAADSERPARLIAEQHAVAGTAFTYALGKLVLWSSTLRLADNAETTLQTAAFDHLAIANPRLAPYGAAAQQVLEKLQLWEALQRKLVQGENIAQTLQFVESGNAELGFIALAQWQALPPARQGAPWQVPTELYAPIAQDAVLLRDSPAGREFITFMQSAAARAAIVRAGYALP